MSMSSKHLSAAKAGTIRDNYFYMRILCGHSYDLKI